MLADGSEALFDVYEAHIQWDGHRRTIPIDESASESLVGMQLMNGYDLRIRIAAQGSVALTRID